MSDFGFLGFAVAAAMFLVLSLLLATSWRGRLQGGLLLLASVISTVWALLFALQSGYRIVPVWLIWGSEAAKNLAWCGFLIGLLSEMARASGASTLFYRLLALVAILASVLLVLPDRVVPGFIFLDVRYLGQVIIAVVGMMLVEQLYRNTAPEQRWGIKYLCFGLGSMFAFDFYLFSDALLFKRIDADLWYARGGIYAITVPLLAISAARNPAWSLEVFVSRRMVFHTTTLLAAGLYMLLMAVAGYYIKLYGGAWGSVLQIVFFFAAVLVLMALLFSGKVRSHAKVFFNKHFFSYRYDYREEWLRLIRLLSGQDTGVPLFERVIWALGEIMESTGGLLFLCPEQQPCQLVAARNQREPEIQGPLELEGMIRFLQERQWVIDLDEYATDPELYDGLELPQWLLEIEQAWIIVPLIHDDRVLGFVLLTRPRVRININWENLDLLKTAGRQAASYIAFYQAARALADAQQFEGFNRLSAFVVHDLKNLIAQLSLVVKNAERHRSNPAFIEDAVRTIDNAVGKMSRLMAHLRSGMPDDRRQRVELSRVLQRVVAEKSARRPVPRLELKRGDLWVYADPDRMEAVIGHVVQNAQDATPADGEVVVELDSEAGQGVIQVRDTGSGMDQEFIRERLFRPFDSTKGLTGMGIGAYECREFVHSVGGRVTVFSRPGEGTLFKISLPLADNVQQTGEISLSAPDRPADQLESKTS
ncbi:MAG TPA: PEP-CTERM system histidine kinase PrsK [Sedimenticola thiotaurini]|uniref:histidine kinase n=1 Tax=Sedimenticola thiotaurini TaxID=1543721 RepID=A0A831RJU4_9GAMM|nr:PEP-CTERM system histidine kinase PrsK [Sedimenticola thiotaurini]